MFIINEDKSIYITRGDAALFAVTAVQDGVPYTFQPNDVVRFKVFEKKGCDTVVLQKDFFVNEACASVDIELLRADTKIGEIIHKPKDFWYEVELNPETYPQTIIGYDEDGAKSFRLLPEGKDLEPDEDEEQQGTAVYDRVLEIVGEMRGHSMQAAANSQTATAAAEAAAQAAENAETVARSIREDAENGVFTPQIGPNGNWMVNGKDTGIPASNANVGSVVETTRTDLGENWVLCNGDPVPEGSMPELREQLMYNTAWRPMAYGLDVGNSVSSNAYNAVRPLPVAGQWFFLNKYTGVATTSKSAAVYDANTEKVVKFSRPTIEDATTTYGIFGLTHDGDRYVLGVSEYSTSSSNIGKMHFFASTDLSEWTKMGTFDNRTNGYRGEDLYFDGTNYVVYEYYTGSSGYSGYVQAIDKSMTTKTQLTSVTNDASCGFVSMPVGYWALVRSSGKTITVYSSVEKKSLFSFSESYNLGRIAFFNERYWFGLPIADTTSTNIQVVDLTTNALTSLSVSTIAANGATVLLGGEYDANTNKWKLYTRYGSTSTYYAVYISADADPTVASSYNKREKISALPEVLSYEQMKSDRSQFFNIFSSSRVLRDPNLKILPEHDGDTYKYIYAGTAAGEEDEA